MVILIEARHSLWLGVRKGVVVIDYTGVSHGCRKPIVVVVVYRDCKIGEGIRHENVSPKYGSR